MVRWEDFPYDGPGMEKLESQPSPQARFVALDGPFSDAKLLTALEKLGIADFYLQYFQKPGVPEAELQADIRTALRRGRGVARFFPMADARLGPQFPGQAVWVKFVGTHREYDDLDVGSL